MRVGAMCAIEPCFETAAGCDQIPHYCPLVRRSLHRNVFADHLINCSMETSTSVTQIMISRQLLLRCPLISTVPGPGLQRYSPGCSKELSEVLDNIKAGSIGGDLPGPEHGNFWVCLLVLRVRTPYGTLHNRVDQVWWMIVNYTHTTLYAHTS